MHADGLLTCSPLPNEESISSSSLACESHLLRIGPNAGSFVVAEELYVDDVGVTAHRAIFNVLLVGATRWIEGYDDPLAASRTDVCPFIGGTTAFILPLLHADVNR